MREERFKYVGTIFYITLLLQLLLTQKGMEIVRELINLSYFSNTPSFAVGVIGFGAVLITSEAMGYFFSPLELSGRLLV